MLSDHVPVLGDGKGYVRLLDVMGSDLTVVNAARVSFEVEHEAMDDSDVRLIQFLAREGHTSPFRHAFASFEVRAPIMTLNQWHRYCVGSDVRDPFFAWNEVSRRYVRDKVEFHHPREWRKAPANAKQGSSDEPLDERTQDYFHRRLIDYQRSGQRMYEMALADGMAPEQARMFLAAYGLYSTVRWSGSLQGILHFLRERLGHGAQTEITEYAEAVRTLIEPHFPHSVRAWLTQP